MVALSKWITPLAMVGFLSCPVLAEQSSPSTQPAQKISYYKEIRPVFQSQCVGCHQPAKAKGKYVMTDMTRLLAGGDSEKPAVTPSQPDTSHLLEMITPKNGEAEMPKDRKALHEIEIDLIKRWIAQGAVDDTPENARQRYDLKHPPIYTRPPVITSIDFSPDGNLLAVAGFHEVILWSADGSKQIGRLVGLSERIESVQFSPDGKRLAVAGGLPCRTGEIQVWDVEKRQLKLSIPITYDTVYGLNWSPDGTLLSFGCADKSVRAVDAKTGEQVLFQGAHDDWVLDTVFTADGKNLISVGRDGTAKITEVATQRFIDNVTSITPGALKGGLDAVTRHPQRDEIVIGGADGIPKVYRIFRLTPRKIGDDACIIRELPAMTGRIFSVAVSPDGKRIAAGSALDGNGEVCVYGYEFDNKLPDDVKRIFSRTTKTWTSADKARAEKYKHDGVKELARLALPRASVYSVAFTPDGKTVAAAGSDGQVRLIDVGTGEIVKSFAPVQIEMSPSALPSLAGDFKAPHNDVKADEASASLDLASIEVSPKSVHIGSRFEYAQLLVTGRTTSGDSIDLTRNATFSLGSDVAQMLPGGVLQPTADGETSLTVTAGGKTADVSISVAGTQRAYEPDYIRDVAPIVSKVGCNAGTCHGAAKGKNGFKLSLRGYDPTFDLRAFTDDHASRRVTVASPDDSLMLLKPTGVAPHEGGVLFRPGDKYYKLFRDWIAAGAKLDAASARVKKIEIEPMNPVAPRPGSRQQFRVLATYADGRIRDVTQEAFIDSGNSDVATTDKFGLATALRRGEAPLLARYEGSYAATTLTVMGDRSGFTWQQPPANNRVDELVAQKWERMRIRPSDLCNDSEFARRTYLDLTGLPPTAEQTRGFLADSRDTRAKRDELIDKLVGNPDYVEFWTNKWADLLEVNRKFLAPEGAAAFRAWIHEQVEKNVPYNQFAMSILTASGSNKDNPAASYFKVLREPQPTLENTTHLFLAVRFNCNKCHDHPFERWTQDQYYQTAAFFAQVDLKPDPASGVKKIGGTAVEDAKPMYEIVGDNTTGEVKHDRTGAVTAPTFPYPAKFIAPEHATRRETMAAWITSPDNQFFARSYVNRLWGYLLGVGIISPIDDIRAGNPPTNPALLDYLTREFIDSGFNTQHIVKLICKSRTYQLSIETNEWNVDDRINYSHAMARRLPAEVLYDAVYRVVGSISNIPGVKAGTRAAALPDSGVDLPTGFLATFGRPARETACECERSTGLDLGPVMSLVSGPTVADAINDAKNELGKLVSTQSDDRKLVDELFIRILSRHATHKEIDAVLESRSQQDVDQNKLSADLKSYAPGAIAARDELEARRKASLAETKAEMADYEAKTAPEVAKAKKDQAESVARLTAELKDYQARELPKRMVAWADKQKTDVEWIPLEPRQMTTSNDVKLVMKDDKSIAIEKESRGAAIFKLVAPTSLKNVTALRLEAIDEVKAEESEETGADKTAVKGAASDEKPAAEKPAAKRAGKKAAKKPAPENCDDAKPAKKGKAAAAAAGATAAPTRKAKRAAATGSGFVLTEIIVKAAAQSDAKDSVSIELSHPLADYTQADLKIDEAVDGDVDNGKRGWSTGPLTGMTHWATFQFDRPISFDDGTNFTIELHYKGGQPIKHFRLSVTTNEEPVGLSLADEYRAILATPAKDRSAEQKSRLAEYYASIDPDIRTKREALAGARKPLEVDPKLKAMQDTIAELSKTTPEDAALVRLRSDVEMSTKQLENRRLTLVQDLTWALINSPEFLFNH